MENARKREHLSRPKNTRNGKYKEACAYLNKLKHQGMENAKKRGTGTHRGCKIWKIRNVTNLG